MQENDIPDIKDGKTGKVKLRKGKGQTRLLARYNAEREVHSAVQQAVVIETYMGGIPDENKANVDASTMIVTDDGNGAEMYEVVSCDKAEYYAQKDPLTSIRFQSGLDMALKWMHYDKVM